MQKGQYLDGASPLDGWTRRFNLSSQTTAAELVANEGPCENSSVARKSRFCRPPRNDAFIIGLALCPAVEAAVATVAVVVVLAVRLVVLAVEVHGNRGLGWWQE